MSAGPSRRVVLAGGIGAAAGLGMASAGLTLRYLRQPLTRVRVLRTSTYDDDFSDRIFEELRAFPRLLSKVPGARVLLKPNLVEARTDLPVTTEPALILAVAEAFLRHGAASVVVGEGPGHVRDIEAVLYGIGLVQGLAERGLPFVDLNIDEFVELRLPGGLSERPVPVARSVVQADLLVSLPRAKTHHLVGVTLGMKNLFGTVPGAVWGWPKNSLHWLGIERSTVGLWSALQPDFTIVDGRVGMEGDGPVQGESIAHGVVVMGEQTCAVDATMARMMGIDPEALATFRLAVAYGGTVSAGRIHVEGDAPVIRKYKLPKGFSSIRLGDVSWAI